MIRVFDVSAWPGCTGLTAPAAPRQRLGITVRLAAPRPQMAKLLRVTGLDRYFTICATLMTTRSPHSGKAGRAG